MERGEGGGGGTILLSAQLRDLIVCYGNYLFIGERNNTRYLLVGSDLRVFIATLRTYCDNAFLKMKIVPKGNDRSDLMC